jgi:hypothetical protein
MFALVFGYELSRKNQDIFLKFAIIKSSLKGCALLCVEDLRDASFFMTLFNSLRNAKNGR